MCVKRYLNKQFTANKKCRFGHLKIADTCIDY